MLDYELITLPEYRAAIAKLEAEVTSEQRNREQAIDAKQEVIDAKVREAQLYKDQLATCEASLKVVTKKRSFWCSVKKFFSFGTNGCR